MNLVWAVIKGDLLTTLGWALVYFVGAIAVAKWRARAAACKPEHLGIPAWARRGLTAEAKFKVAQMRQRRRRYAKSDAWRVR